MNILNEEPKHKNTNFQSQLIPEIPYIHTYTNTIYILDCFFLFIQKNWYIIHFTCTDGQKNMCQKGSNIDRSKMQISEQHFIYQLETEILKYLSSVFKSKS